MKTTINLDDDLVKCAMELAGIHEKTALVNEGLRALIEKKARERLAKLGGSLPHIAKVPRRRI